MDRTSGNICSRTLNKLSSPFRAIQSSSDPGTVTMDANMSASCFGSSTRGWFLLDRLTLHLRSAAEPAVVWSSPCRCFSSAISYKNRVRLSIGENRTASTINRTFTPPHLPDKVDCRVSADKFPPRPARARNGILQQNRRKSSCSLKLHTCVFDTLFWSSLVKVTFKSWRWIFGAGRNLLVQLELAGGNCKVTARTWSRAPDHLK